MLYFLVSDKLLKQAKCVSPNTHTGLWYYPLALRRDPHRRCRRWRIPPATPRLLPGCKGKTILINCHINSASSSLALLSRQQVWETPWQMWAVYFQTKSQSVPVNDKESTMAHLCFPPHNSVIGTFFKNFTLSTLYNAGWICDVWINWSTQNKCVTLKAKQQVVQKEIQHKYIRRNKYIKV